MKKPKPAKNRRSERPKYVNITVPRSIGIVKSTGVMVHVSRGSGVMSFSKSTEIDSKCNERECLPIRWLSATKSSIRHQEEILVVNFRLCSKSRAIFVISLLATYPRNLGNNAHGRSSRFGININAKQHSFDEYMTSVRCWRDWMATWLPLKFHESGKPRLCICQLTIAIKIRLEFSLFGVCR